MLIPSCPSHSLGIYIRLFSTSCPHVTLVTYGTFFVLLILLLAPTLINPPLTSTNMAETNQNRHSDVDQLPILFSLLRMTRISAMTKATSSPHPIIALIIAMSDVIWLRTSAEKIFSVSSQMLANLCLGVPMGTTQENFTLLWRSPSRRRLHWGSQS